MVTKIVKFLITRPYHSLSSRSPPSLPLYPTTMNTNVAGPDVPPTVSTSIPRSMSRSSVNSVHIAGGSFTSPSPTLWSGESQEAEALVEGLRHARVKLEARQYKSPIFAQQLLELFNILRVPSWSKSAVKPQTLSVRKVSGSLTNAVFFVSSTSTSSRTLLLRIYGPSSGSLISRPRELHTLHVLSSAYHMGPRIYGTFDNGRIEEYFDSVTLTASDIRDARTSGYIGARMAELHGVDIAAIEGTPPSSPHGSAIVQIGAKKNVRSWFPPARHVLALPSLSPGIRDELDLDVFQAKWERYVEWLQSWETRGASKRVFCHNDAQYGNLLKLNKFKEGVPEHHQIIVVDFEYASPNPAAFDIANHFHEWTANYHSPTPHVLDPTLYPTLEQRRNFYLAYLTHVQPSLPTGCAQAFSSLSAPAREGELDRLEEQVRAWSPASHAMWAVWGIVQAREDVEANVTQPEFDYIAYARYRMAAFYNEIEALGL
ncbi:kinase-like protein [Artomyces pyxidatus]|uniref:Kinase-like protein n=1 Tax=Artomyces pyxidatus TaxID=48021 RepID=A0ACB8TH62_9AGAM|nr:kinase-like protein [Artomyces pyxidatus]